MVTDIDTTFHGDNKIVFNTSQGLEITNELFFFFFLKFFQDIQSLFNFT